MAARATMRGAEGELPVNEPVRICWVLLSLTHADERSHEAAAPDHGHGQHAVPLRSTAPHTCAQAAVQTFSKAFATAKEHLARSLLK